MNSNKLIITGTLSCVLMCVLVGCGKPAVPRTELIGEISFDGRPVTDAQVYLSTKGADKKTQATYTAIVSDGVFQLEGPPPGTYDLTINTVEEDSEVVFEQIREKKRKALLDRNKLSAAVARKCPMRVELSTEQLNSVKVELTSR